MTLWLVKWEEVPFHFDPPSSKVDYFDINCRLEPEQCTDGRMAKLVRTLNAALPEGESAIHVLETMQTGVQECAQKSVVFGEENRLLEIMQLMF
jgi:hypothetical protein